MMERKKSMDSPFIVQEIPKASICVNITNIFMTTDNSNFIKNIIAEETIWQWISPAVKKFSIFKKIKIYTVVTRLQMTTKLKVGDN